MALVVEAENYNFKTNKKKIYNSALYSLLKDSLNNFYLH